jgi:chemotaxis protein histidine kinase CheA
MKFRSHLLIFISLFLFAATTLLGGCATTGMDRSVKTTNSIKEVDTEIRKMSVQIDITASSLDSLVKAGQPDLKKSFDAYSDNLIKLEKEGKLVIKRTEEMKASSKEYFSEWEKQGDAFTNQEIRELSAERRNKLAEIYARVPAAGAGVKGSYNAYLTDLKEIQKYLSTDLTPKGVEAIAPVAQKSVQNLDALKISLKPVIAALDEIKAELYSGKK